MLEIWLVCSDSQNFPPTMNWVCKYFCFCICRPGFTKKKNNPRVNQFLPSTNPSALFLHKIVPTQEVPLRKQARRRARTAAKEKIVPRGSGLTKSSLEATHYCTESGNPCARNFSSWNQFEWTHFFVEWWIFYCLLTTWKFGFVRSDIQLGWEIDQNAPGRCGMFVANVPEKIK